MRCNGILSATLTAGLLLSAASPAVKAASLTFERNLAQVEPGTSFAGRVTLDAAATVNTCVALASSDPALVSVPANVTIPAGSLGVDFRVQVARTAVTAASGISIQASLAPCVAPEILQRNFSVLAGAAVARIDVSPGAVQGSEATTLTVQLDRPAVYPGVAVILANTNNGLVAQPKTVTVAAGQQSASTVMTTRTVVVPAVVGVSATTTGTAVATTQVVLHGSPGSGEQSALAGITAAHNEVRASVGVAPLRWNASLAATAEQWAGACVDKIPPAGLIDHNAGRSAGYPYAIGENLYSTSEASVSVAGAIAAWAAEATAYNYATNTCSGVCSHYTQVVWRNTLEVGCGTAVCPNLQYRAVLVCNYAPAGNVGGQRPY